MLVAERMKSIRIKILLLCFCLLYAENARAQFYTGGAEPASVKWYYTSTPHFTLIYPQGLDSLTKVYGNLLEKYRPAESWSSGYIPGEKYKKRTPVLIRPFTAISNGMVSWAPKRMELYTLPSQDGAEASIWAKNLAIHESRHLSQMQFGYDRFFKPFNWILGEIVPGLAVGVYPGLHLMEGDAVVAETALTGYGRGRSAFFLNYYMSAFDSGDYRNWYRWRYGSFRKFTPDHYSLGYLTLAGTRYFYDDPLYMSKYFEKVSKRPWRLFNMQKGIKDVSNYNFKQSFREIMLGFQKIWNDEALDREPFIESETLTKPSKFYISYNEVLPIKNNFLHPSENILAVKSGNINYTSLVCLSADGKEKSLRPFAGNFGYLHFSPALNRLYWSEPISDKRWKMNMSSRIRYINLADNKLNIFDLTKKGRLYNPSVSEDGSILTAIDYPINGGSEIVFMDPLDGQEKGRMRSPDSLQFVQAVWQGKEIIVSGISDKGIGLYRLSHSDNNRLRQIIPPIAASIRALHSHNEDVMFTCDRTGVDEIYLLRNDTILQLTATKYGAADGHFNHAGDTLYYTSLGTYERGIHKTAIDKLLYKKVDFNTVHKYKVAEALTAQEKAIAASKGEDWPDDNKTFQTVFSAPKQYRKVPGIPHFHSWVPLYFDNDNFSSINFNSVYSTVSPGAMAYFQNILGTAYGSIGYSYNKQPGQPKYFHGGHINFTYTGLHPVFEFKADFNDRYAYQYSRRTVLYQGRKIERVMVKNSNFPHFSTSLNAYIPFKFSSGGIVRGLTPRIRYRFSNDLFDKSEVLIYYNEPLISPKTSLFFNYTPADNVFMHTLTVSMSGYIMQTRPKMLDYPRLGIGIETGYNVRLYMQDMYASNIYAYLYGYIPGLYKSHGLKLSAMYQHQFYKNSIFGENYVSTMPRGFTQNISNHIASISGNQLKITADYPIPIYVGDISFLAPITYITHFVVSPHIDYTFLSLYRGFLNGGLASLGVNVIAKAAHFIWIPYQFEIGLQFDWNTGPSLNNLISNGIKVEKLYFGPLFRASF